MGSKIELVNETDEGDLTLIAIYEKSDTNPRFVKITDNRVSDGSDPTTLRFQYDDKKQKLGLLNLDDESDIYSDSQSVEDMLDDQTQRLIKEIYEEDIQIGQWTTTRRILEMTGRKFTGYIDRIRDSIH